MPAVASTTIKIRTTVLKLNFMIHQEELPNDSNCIRHLTSKTNDIQMVEDLLEWQYLGTVVGNMLLGVVRKLLVVVYIPQAVAHNMNVPQVRLLLHRPGQEPPNSCCYSTHYCNTPVHGIRCIHHGTRCSMPMLARKWLHQLGTMLQVTSS